MIDRLSKHAFYYISLILILLSGFFLAYINPSNKEIQIGAVVLTTFFYVSWGILHHLINHDLTAKIVIEYILIGSFGLVVLLFLFKSGLGI